MDGWSDVNKQDIVNRIVCIPKLYFIRSIRTCAHSHTAQNMFDELETDIAKIGSDKITAVGTDNAANMKLMMEMVKLKYLGIEVIGCAAHGFNLMLNDILKLPAFTLFCSCQRTLFER